MNSRTGPHADTPHADTPHADTPHADTPTHKKRTDTKKARECTRAHGEQGERCTKVAHDMPFAHTSEMQGSVLQCAAVCCSVLQCVAVCCSVLQCLWHTPQECTAVYCSVLHCVALHCNVLQYLWHTPQECKAVNCTELQCVAVRCSVLQCVVVCCRAFGTRFKNARQCVVLFTVCCSVLHCVVLCCSMLQCAGVCCSALDTPKECKAFSGSLSCSMSQCVAVCRSVSQCDAVCRSMLQCVTVCCSVLQCHATHVCVTTSSSIPYDRPPKHRFMGGGGGTQKPTENMGVFTRKAALQKGKRLRYDKKTSVSDTQRPTTTYTQTHRCCLQRQMSALRPQSVSE